MNLCIVYIIIYSYFIIRNIIILKSPCYFQIYLFLFKNQKHYKLSDFIDKKTPITAEAFSYFIEFDRINFLNNYQKITPNNTETQYHTLLPFHSDGLSKKIIDYHDLVDINNTKIIHFTTYINGKDKHIDDKSSFLLHTQNEGEKIEESRQKKYTLIYLITVSKPTKQIIRQIEGLSHPDVCFIIFYDNKANRRSFYQLFSNKETDERFKNVYFVDSPRFIIKWAHITQAFSQVIMNLASIKYFPRSKYISFHSESDYRIVPNDIIVNYLKMNYPKNYMITFQDRKRKAYRKNTFRLLLNRDVDEKVCHLLYKLFPKKVIPSAEWRCGWNWFTINLKDSKKMMEVMLDRFDIVDTLEYVQYADEIIFSTLAAQANISITNNYLRFIDWTGCNAHPNVLTERNFKDIVTFSQNCSFWARKFKYDESRKVLNMIDEYVNNNNNHNNISYYCKTLFL